MLKPMQRRQLLGAALTAGAASGLVVGTVSRVAGSSSHQRAWPPVLRNAARAVLVGEAYDHAAKAAQNEDMAGLTAAHDELQQLAANVTVTEQIVAQANQLDADAESLQGKVRRTQQARAAALYREALRLAPHFDSQDPQMLNGLGYFLADHGASPADFKEAERLTRRAVQLWDARIAQLTTSDSFKLNRAITRDSLAWALFKEGQYEPARIEQERAVADWQAIVRDNQGTAALHFHLGEIYRTLHRPNDARLQYQQAVRLDPQDEASKKALANLGQKP